MLSMSLPRGEAPRGDDWGIIDFEQLSPSERGCQPGKEPVSEDQILSQAATLDRPGINAISSGPSGRGDSGAIP